ncbi:hypothetical protein K2P47_02020 [Patescibacteria group bacterium]|nr:hypothetical protein [Patescibacteria group bacterium]
MVDATYFGLAAGIFQLAGYIAYYILVIRKEGKEAEPLTWFMFAYGTALLTVMELDSMWKEAAADVSWMNVFSVLLLPIICSLGGIGVAVGIWRANLRLTGEWWPQEWKVEWKETDGKAFAADIALTICYTVLWIFTLFGTTEGNTHLWWVIAFLVASNLTTFPNFVPILRQAWAHPEKEDARPWTIWAVAYALLLVPTWVHGSDGMVWPISASPLTWDVSFYAFLALMSYPVINTVMHGLMAIFAGREPKPAVMNPAE